MSLNRSSAIASVTSGKNRLSFVVAVATVSAMSLSIPHGQPPTAYGQRCVSPPFHPSSTLLLARRLRRHVVSIRPPAHHPDLRSGIPKPGSRAHLPGRHVLQRSGPCSLH